MSNNKYLELNGVLSLQSMVRSRRNLLNDNLINSCLHIEYPPICIIPMLKITGIMNENTNSNTGFALINAITEKDATMYLLLILLATVFCHLNKNVNCFF